MFNSVLFNSIVILESATTMPKLPNLRLFHKINGLCTDDCVVKSRKGMKQVYIMSLLKKN